LWCLEADFCVALLLGVWTIAVDPSPSTYDSSADDSGDIQAIVKQLVFSPIKAGDNETDISSVLAAAQAALAAAEEVSAAAEKEDETSVETQIIPEELHAAVQSPVAAAPVVVEEKAPIVAEPETVLEIPLVTEAVTQPVEEAVQVPVAAPIVAAIEAVQAPAVAASAPADVDGTEEDHLFPTFATAVQSEELAYVSAEHKTQEILLLEATKPEEAAEIKNTVRAASSTRRSASVSAGRSRSRSSSAHSTPSGSAKKKSTSDRLAAPTFSSSKRAALAIASTPRAATIRSESLPRQIGATPAQRVAVAQPSTKKKKLTTAASPKLST
jgi:hypothetical protein